jgi:hypothetical protein
LPDGLECDHDIACMLFPALFENHCSLAHRTRPSGETGLRDAPVVTVSVTLS